VDTVPQLGLGIHSGVGGKLSDPEDQTEDSSELLPELDRGELDLKKKKGDEEA
jgi:hypothetical protein